MKIIVIGAGGHAKVIIEVIRAAGHYDILGLIDPGEIRSLLGVPVLGDDAQVASLYQRGVRTAVVALGNNRLRQEIGTQLCAVGFDLPALVHPGACLSPSARIEGGAVVMCGATVGTEATVRRLAIINTGAIVEHDNDIGEAAHIGPGCALAGSVRIGERALVGVGSAVRPNVSIGADATVGAGSAVVADVPPGAVVGGVPARRLHLSSTRSGI